MKHLSFANRWNAELIDDHYNQWLSDPESLSPEWRAFFEGFELGKDRAGVPTPTTGEAIREGHDILQGRVIGAIYAFRSIGHTNAHFNPLLKTVPFNPRLSLDRLGISEADLDSVYHTGNYLGGKMMKIRDILDQLRETYCNTIGVEYLHIQQTGERRWLQAKMEPILNNPDFSDKKKKRTLRKVTEAETFENFLHSRYPGQKRFGIEGAETTIAAIDALVEACPQNDICEIVMGMAHRGRLNMLANIMGKSYEFIFKEFSSDYIPESMHGDGDVKYHLGYETVRNTSDGGEVEIRLAANPSHLEAVNPIVEGKARARQRLIDDKERKKVLPVLIHGDAAIAGQGITAEVFNLAKLKGYSTGGTIHFVINNQIGFTTDPKDSRSSLYCTDLAKMIEAPIFHVNGDDPLRVVMVMELALAYRQEYASDVVIDMYCYRKHGHNESDEPAFTQPLLYRDIKTHDPVSVILAKQLVEEGTLTREEANSIKNEFQDVLSQAFEKDKQVSQKQSKRSDPFRGSTAVFQPPYNFRAPETGVPLKKLENIVTALTSLPENFKANKKIIRQLKERADIFKEDKGIDWAFAEALAFGSLMIEGTPVRLSGQDSERGTFSQRHSTLYDAETREKYVPLQNIDPKQASFCVHNSSLSEAAVLGFDFGYSMEHPRMLCLWEAQFGDFSNGAQVIIDQFIASSESKWQRISGLVLLLPHGYEGQGPEHSSARLERFLQLCAEENMQVCNLSTPAQYFHCLRRQMRQPYRKPLILMAPKSLLRNKACVSPRNDLVEDRFYEILDDNDASTKAKRVIFCTGKVYYDLINHRDAQEIKDAAIVRLEQISPFNTATIEAIFDKYKAAKSFVWCQEEPKNMGAWFYVNPLFEDCKNGKRLSYAGRRAAASPAVGSLAIHKIEQQTLVQQAFKID